MRVPFDFENPNPVLCVGTRNGLPELIHRGAVCVVAADADGSYSIQHAVGNIQQWMYLRSAAKFVQVLPLVESGALSHFRFSEEELAVMCASHWGEPFHLAAVRSILGKIGCEEGDLGCGGHAPMESCAYDYVRAGAPTPFVQDVYNNCSGKHAGFLALCKFLGHPIKGYLDPDHPVQRLVKEATCDVFCISPDTIHTGVDGCSAPAFAMPVFNASLGFARLCTAHQVLADTATPPRFEHVGTPLSETRRAAIRRIVSAITTHPHLVRGTGEFCTQLMRAGRGRVIGKIGAGGVYVSGIVGHGLGCAVKIDDGSRGPADNVTMGFLVWAAALVGSPPEGAAGEATSPVGAEEAPAGDSDAVGAAVAAGTHEGAGSPGPVASRSPALGALPPHWWALEDRYITPDVNCAGRLVGHRTVVPGVFPVEPYRHPPRP